MLIFQALTWCRLQDSNPRPTDYKCEAALEHGFTILREGQNPGDKFWRALAFGLRCGHLECFTGNPPQFPLKLRLEFRDLDHRPTDPELADRNRLVRWFVERSLEEGMKKRPAFERVAAELGMSESRVRSIFYSLEK